MKLTDNWPQAWKWLSTQLGAAVAVAPVLYELFPKLFQPYLSPKMFALCMMALGVAVMVNAVRAKS